MERTGKEASSQDTETLQEDLLSAENDASGSSQNEDRSSDISKINKDVETEIAEIKDQLLRALAEAENVRRRAAQDKEDALKYGMTNFARDILTIADNLRRALDHVDTQNLPDNLKPFIEGVEITEKELLTVLERHGIKQVNPLGEKFDSHLHQAMLEQESETHSPGTVIDVMQAGYTIHGRLLRPAMVMVAKKK